MHHLWKETMKLTQHFNQIIPWKLPEMINGNILMWIIEFWNIDIASNDELAWLIISSGKINCWFQLDFATIQSQTIFKKLNLKFQAD